MGQEDLIPIRHKIVKMLLKKSPANTEAKWIVKQAGIIIDFIVKGNYSEEEKQRIIDDFLNK